MDKTIAHQLAEENLNNPDRWLEEWLHNGQCSVFVRGDMLRFQLKDRSSIVWITPWLDTGWNIGVHSDRLHDEEVIDAVKESYFESPDYCWPVVVKGLGDAYAYPKEELTHGR